MTISGEHPLAYGKCGVQLQHRGMRQLQIVDQCVEAQEFIAGNEEQLGLARERLDAARAGGALERTNRGRANRDHTPAPLARLTNRSATGGVDLHALTVQPVLLDMLVAQCLERARADVLGNPGVPDAGREGLLK